MKHLTLLLAFISFTSFAQISGVIKDDKGKAMPYTNVWTESGEIGTTTDMMGKFTLPREAENQNLIVYACGFNIERIKPTGKVLEIRLTPNETETNDKAVKANRETIETGVYNLKKDVNRVYSSAVKAPKIHAKYFPKVEHQGDKVFYIKSIKASFSLLIPYKKQRPKSPRVKVRFFSVDENGYPGHEIHNEDIIVNINDESALIDVEKYSIEIPDNGIIVGFEWIFIPDNFREFTDQEETIELCLPSIALIPTETNSAWEFQGQWRQFDRRTKNKKDPFSEKYAEPAISLILTD